VSDSRRTRERAEERAREPEREPEDDLVISGHVLRTARGELRYTARTGRVVLREEESRRTSSAAGGPARRCR
jgi:hypothetical protein